MRLASAQELKRHLLETVVFPAFDPAPAGALAVGAQPPGDLPNIARSIALGVAPANGTFRLAIRLQRPSLVDSPIVTRLVAAASGEADVRVVGRIDKRPRRARRARRAGSPPAEVVASALWQRDNQRPLLIGSSIAHEDVTAGTLGAFVTRAKRVGVLSNNHVLANENLAVPGDWVLQRAPYDGGRAAERVARFRHMVKLTTKSPNLVDAALAILEPDVAVDAGRLRGLVGGRDRVLAGAATAPVTTGDIVYKVGRTTGATTGRVTAFEMDNVVVRYSAGNLRFNDQIEIEGTGRFTFSDGGDSGSLIVNERMEAVGLLFAGGDQGGSNGLGLTYANVIGTVLTRLKATLLT